MVKRWFNRAIFASCLCIGVVQIAYAQEVRLVGNKVETFINDGDQPSRLTSLVSAALEKTPHEITATTQAWSGSGLRNGQFDGYIDHYSLNDPKQNYIHSAPYVQLFLHVASTESRASNISRLDKLNRQRVGLETRFANTDQVRSERSVSWARTQDFFNNIKQLAEGRVDYIVADKVMLDEMNKKLVAVGQETLYIAAQPIFTVDVSLAMRSDYGKAQQIIESFESGIQALRDSGRYEEIYLPDSGAESILDAIIYEEMIKRW
ncbi:substrate-binding periplasmic protein [Glaciecola sp. SC05]|uniref:substrate-binding periplasmic protein n=1 Tax=Glaciecola sp. SC05 TaxID=1987355 RepID=UPI003528CCE6